MCDCCEVVRINGVPCHEHNCQNDWLHPITMEPYPRECFYCGCDFYPETKFGHICEDCQFLD